MIIEVNRPNLPSKNSSLAIDPKEIGEITLLKFRTDVVGNTRLRVNHPDPDLVLINRMVLSKKLTFSQRRGETDSQGREEGAAKPGTADVVWTIH
jgi:hypothetical protein